MRFSRLESKILKAAELCHAVYSFEKEVSFLYDLVEKGIAVPSDGTQTITPAQEYKCYPAMYKNSVQWSVTGRCNYYCRPGRTGTVFLEQSSSSAVLRTAFILYYIVSSSYTRRGFFFAYMAFRNGIWSSSRRPKLCKVRCLIAPFFPLL